MILLIHEDAPFLCHLGSSLVVSFVECQLEWELFFECNWIDKVKCCGLHVG